MGLNVKSADGKNKGYIDVASDLQRQVPGAQIQGFDPQTGELSFKAGDKQGSINLKNEVSRMGAEIESIADFNSPQSAADVSPLTWKERFDLGVLTRESSDFQRLLSGINNVYGGSMKPDLVMQGKEEKDTKLDALTAKNEQRALAHLKKRFDDASISNGEIVVKQNGVWKKVDSSSDSIGEDAAQLVGSTGLNILGSIAGAKLISRVPYVGPAIAPLGGALGSAAAELGEEALAFGIAGGTVDVEGAARDLATEFTLGLAGDVAGKGLEKLAGSAITRLGASPAVQAVAETRVVKGLQEVARSGAAKSKDIIANVYASLNKNLSFAPLREAIESPENVKLAHGYSKAMSKLDPSAANPLLRDMATELQTSVEGAYKVAQKDFGQVLEKVRTSVDDSFSIDLEQTVKDLNAATFDYNSLTGASRDKRAYFDAIGNEAKDIARHLKAQGEPPVLYGKKAFEYLERAKYQVTQKLEGIGAHDKMAMTSADRLLEGSLNKIRSYFDAGLMDAAERTEMSPAYTAMKKRYGAVKDNLDVIWSKSMSNKGDQTFAQNLAKGNVAPNILEALIGVNPKQPGLSSLVPEAKVTEMLKSIRLKQAGIEMAPLFKEQDLIRAGAVTVASGGAGLLPAVSPRIAGRMAAGTARVSDTLSKASLSAALSDARKQAKRLMTLGATSGFVHGLGQAGGRSLLQNPDALQALIDKASRTADEVSSIDENSVTEAAIRRVQQEGNGQ